MEDGSQFTDSVVCQRGISAPCKLSLLQGMGFLVAKWRLDDVLMNHGRSPNVNSCAPKPSMIAHLTQLCNYPVQRLSDSKRSVLSASRSLVAYEVAQQYCSPYHHIHQHITLQSQMNSFVDHEHACYCLIYLIRESMYPSLSRLKYHYFWDSELLTTRCAPVHLHRYPQGWYQQHPRHQQEPRRPSLQHPRMP